jgi:hypothetical protein
LQAVLRYRGLLQVEDLFRRGKAILRTRLIDHSSDVGIRGYVFCLFLALMLQKELTDLCQRYGLPIEWANLLRDLDRLQEATIGKDGKRITTRTAVPAKSVPGRWHRPCRIIGTNAPPDHPVDTWRKSVS